MDSLHEIATGNWSDSVRASLVSQVFVGWHFKKECLSKVDRAAPRTDINGHSSAWLRSSVTGFAAAFGIARRSGRSTLRWSVRDAETDARSYPLELRVTGKKLPR